jgi:transcriptional regulator with XRE-family HTH domain
MAKKRYSYVRAHRRKWGFTQVELARLVGLSSRSPVSRIERSERVPTAAIIVAFAIIFDLGSADLFPSLYEEVEHEVLSGVRALLAELGDGEDRATKRKRALLVDIQERISQRKQQQEV